MLQSIRAEVRCRAQRRCEYCRLPQEFDVLPFQLDHVLARKHRGRTTKANLAWSCYNCNAHKGSNLAGIDPKTKYLTRLFHPRKDVWARHFQWSGATLEGRTAVGRTTVAVLRINDLDRIELRRQLL